MVLTVEPTLPGDSGRCEWIAQGAGSVVLLGNSETGKSLAPCPERLGRIGGGKRTTGCAGTDRI